MTTIETIEMIELLLNDFNLEQLKYIFALTDSDVEESVYRLFEFNLDIDQSEAIYLINKKIREEEARLQAEVEDKLIYEI